MENEEEGISTAQKDAAGKRDGRCSQQVYKFVLMGINGFVARVARCTSKLLARRRRGPR